MNKFILVERSKSLFITTFSAICHCGFVIFFCSFSIDFVLCVKKTTFEIVSGFHLKNKERWDHFEALSVYIFKRPPIHYPPARSFQNHRQLKGLTCHRKTINYVPEATESSAPIGCSPQSRIGQPRTGCFFFLCIPARPAPFCRTQSYQLLNKEYPMLSMYYP